MGNFKREKVSVAFKAEVADKEAKGNTRLQEMSKCIEKYTDVRAGRCMNRSEIFYFLLPSLRREEGGFELHCALDPSHTGFQCKCAFPYWCV